MALDGNGRWCYLDPRLGAMHAVAEAARNVACAGATPIGGTNCLNFGNPEKPHIMWQFSQVIVSDFRMYHRRFVLDQMDSKRVDPPRERTSCC